jgi:hypothetical protein
LGPGKAEWASPGIPGARTGGEAADLGLPGEGMRTGRAFGSADESPPAVRRPA